MQDVSEGGRDSHRYHPLELLDLLVSFKKFEFKSASTHRFGFTGPLTMMGIYEQFKHILKVK